PAGLPVGLLLDAVDEPHVRAAAARDPHGIRVERPVGAARVPQDRVVFAAEAAPALAADRVAPHQLVDEAVAAEQPVERDLDVVDRAVIEVNEQRAVVGEEPPAMLEVWSEPRDERIRIVGSVGVGETATMANDAGPEWRIDVNRVE